MPELRIDPIVGRRVYVAEDRAGRPNDYVGASLQAPHPVSERLDNHCYFCAGNESHTPVASATVLDGSGRWRVRVVPNKYPAVMLDQTESAAFGAHEVIIEAPHHILDVVELAVEDLAVILAVYRDRLAHWSRDGRLKHAAIFKNSGYDAGASLEHVHSQLVALPYVPEAVQAEIDGVARFREATGRCVFCDLIERETAAGERVVMRQNGYAAICAYAPRQPYETWVLPERHAPRFEMLQDADLNDQAGVLHELLRRLQAASPAVAYNLLLHTAPYATSNEAYHWHWELVPRLTHEAGLEWGGGVYITPLSPERAAAELRRGGAP
jgi:UDPglucose--hexose-1-phosphate uridylyltransferase